MQMMDISQGNTCSKFKNLFVAKTEDLLDIKNEEKLKAPRIAKRQE